MNYKYSELLLDQRWKDKKREIILRDNKQCRICFRNGVLLVVHHIKYQSIIPWETENEYLITLCEKCHDKIHVLKDLSVMEVLYGIKIK